MPQLTPTMRSYIAFARFEDAVGRQRIKDALKATIPNNATEAAKIISENPQAQAAARVVAKAEVLGRPDGSA